MIQGVVVAGKGEARTLGYPTANIVYEHEMVLEPGVYYAKADVNGNEYRALAVVGMWTLENGLPSVEVHILDFEGDLYEKELKIEIHEKLRELEAFSSVETLIERIKLDVEAARRYGQA